MLVAEDLMNDLGIETEQRPTAKDIKRQGLWITTDVKGVYVAGDAGTPIFEHRNCDGARYDLVVDWYYGIELMTVTTGSIAAAAIAHESCAMRAPKLYYEVWGDLRSSDWRRRGRVRGLLK
jgi:hypothetical protein